jgi:fused signal recognition particle receptor
VTADSEARKGNGFFAKLKARLNRGKTWLTGDLFGLFGKGIDEDTLTELEDELLLADVGVEVTD